MIDGRAQAEAAAVNDDAKDRRIAELEQQVAKLRLRIALADNLTSWRFWRDELIADGYARHAPGGMGWAAIDGQAAAHATCEECGHTGMRYEPFFRANPHSYRAFAVCRACGAFIEF